jgi:hypothetical protein
MQGMNIPTGAAVPEVRDRNMNHMMAKIRAFGKRIVLLFDMKLLMVLDYPSNIRVASLSKVPSLQRNYLVGTDGISFWQI